MNCCYETVYKTFLPDKERNFILQTQQHKQIHEDGQTSQKETDGREDRSIDNNLLFYFYSY